MRDHTRRAVARLLFHHSPFIRLSILVAPKDHPWKTFASTSYEQMCKDAARALTQPTPAEVEREKRKSPFRKRGVTGDIWSSVVGAGALAGPSVAGVIATLAATNQLPISF